MAYTYNIALTDAAVKTGLVAVIRNSSVIFTIFLSGFLLKEKRISEKVVLTFIQIIGIALLI